MGLLGFILGAIVGFAAALVLVSLFPQMMTAVASSFRNHLPFVVLR